MAEKPIIGNDQPPIGPVETAGIAGSNDKRDSAKSTKNDGGPSVIDPKTIKAGSGSADSETGKRGRGRPKGSAKASGSEKVAAGIPLKAEPVNDPETIAATLMLTHSGLSFALKAPELEIDKQEADVLTASLLKVSRHYPNVAIPAKTLDWLNLLGVVGACYGGRFARIKERKTKERAEKHAAQTAA